MAYSQPYKTTTFKNGEWFVWNANGIITTACESLWGWIGMHKQKLLFTRADEVVPPKDQQA